MKKTKIICSIGPASNQPEVMSQMVQNGMNIARLNFSHATDEEKNEHLEALAEKARVAAIVKELNAKNKKDKKQKQAKKQSKPTKERKPVRFPGT